MLASLASAPPVRPRPRAEIIGTKPPPAGITGARIRLTVSPTPSWGNRPHFGADQPRRPQPRRSMRWADVYVCMLADGVALRNRCPQGQADPRAAIAGGASRLGAPGSPPESLPSGAG